MSSVSIQGNASGTGIFTIASPNSNTNRTLTLPDNAGTVLSTASSLSGLTGVGKVLQSVTASFTNVTVSSTSTGTSATEWGNLTITPTTSGNYLLVIAQGVCQFGEACQGESQCWITYAASGVSETIAANTMSGNETSNIRTYNPFGMTVRITTSTTNQYTIRMRSNGVDVFGVAKSTGWTRNQIVVLEIAA
jgi:hypothetical protein